MEIAKAIGTPVAEKHTISFRKSKSTKVLVSLQHVVVSLSWKTVWAGRGQPRVSSDIGCFLARVWSDQKLYVGVLLISIASNGSLSRTTIYEVWKLLGCWMS